MVRIDAVTARYTLIPIICNWTTGEKLGDNDRDEPGYDNDSDGDVPQGESPDGKDSVVEEEYGEFEGGGRDWEDASGREKQLVSKLACWIGQTWSIV